MNFKDIEIGSLISAKVIENKIEMSRICNFFKLSDRDIEEMYHSKSMDTELLLKWSKLLEYDFFRIYTQHLILYAPQAKAQITTQSKKKIKSNLPMFRKNIYTKEVIDFIIELIENGQKTKEQVIREYEIPKTTLYKWVNKFKKE